MVVGWSCLTSDRVAGINRGLTIATVVKQVQVWCLLLLLEAPWLIESIRTHFCAQWFTLAGDISASVIDLTIAGSITYLLYRGRTGFPKYEAFYMSFT